MEKIYTVRPWTLARWKKIRRELWLLIACVAFLVFLNHFVEAFAWWLVHTIAK